ncbi:unnamed protein product, partial [Mesorhabditis belari]|uniref:Uncharacterized protein n=1 Tax=Mesorhabditis belari TaxID=2138241 RepID=A0AAF3JB95_9BILA
MLSQIFVLATVIFATTLAYQSVGVHGWLDCAGQKVGRNVPVYIYNQKSDKWYHPISNSYTSQSGEFRVTATDKKLQKPFIVIAHRCGQIESSCYWLAKLPIQSSYIVNGTVVEKYQEFKNIELRKYPDQKICSAKAIDAEIKAKPLSAADFSI